MTQPKNGAFSAFLDELAGINLQTARQAKPRKIEDGETILGQLGDDLQKLWILRDRKAQIVTEISDRIDDLTVVHLREHLDKKAIKESCEAFHGKIEEIYKELHVPGREFRVIDNLFWHMVGLDFPESDKAHTLGIREGKILIKRDNDNRGDGEDIFAKITVTMSFGH